MNRGSQRHGPGRVLLRCRSTCGAAHELHSLFLARAQPGPWNVHVPVRLSTLPCPRAPSAAQVSSRARQDERDFTLRCTVILASRDSVATKVQVSTTVRQAAAFSQGRVSSIQLPQLQAPCSLPENSRSYQHSLGERLSWGCWEDHQSVKSSSAQTVAGSEPRPLAKCWSTSVARPSAFLSEQTWRDFITNSHASRKPATDARTQTLSFRK